MKASNYSMQSSYFLLFSLFAFSCVIRLISVADYSLWFDEALNFRIISNSWGSLWISNFDPTPPLYYSLLKLFVSPETNEVFIRLPSIIFGSLTVVVFYKICKTQFSSSISFFVSVLFSLSYHQLEYSQEARAYSMQLFFAIAAFYCAYLAACGQREETKLLIGTYSLFSLLSLYTHNIAVFHILGINLLFFYFCIIKKDYSKLKFWILCNTLVLFLWLPWPIVTIFSGEGNTFNWLKHISPFQFILSTGKSIKLSPNPDEVTLLDGLFLTCILLGVFYAIRRSNKNLLISIVLMAIPSLLFVWLIGFVKPIFMDRTVIISSILAYLTLPFLLANFNRKVTISLGVSLTIIHLISYYQYVQNRYSENEQWAQAVKSIEQSDFNNILICSTSPSWVISYYLSDKGINVYTLGTDYTKASEVNNIMKSKMMLAENGKEDVGVEIALQELENPVFVDSHCKANVRTELSKFVNLEAVSTNKYKRIDLYKIQSK
jgi:uncharacterized membrane protein